MGGAGKDAHVAALCQECPRDSALPRLKARGTLTIGGAIHAIDGTAWLDDLALISEPYADHAQLKLGDALALPTPSGTVTSRVAGIDTDYGSGAPAVLP